MRQLYKSRHVVDLWIKIGCLISDKSSAEKDSIHAVLQAIYICLQLWTSFKSQGQNCAYKIFSDWWPNQELSRKLSQKCENEHFRFGRIQHSTWYRGQWKHPQERSLEKPRLRHWPAKSICLNNAPVLRIHVILVWIRTCLWLMDPDPPFSSLTIKMPTEYFLKHFSWLLLFKGTFT